MRRNPRRSHYLRAVAVLVAGTLPGCGGDDLMLPGDGGPARIEAVQGSDQQGVVGAALAESLVVRVTDGQERPVLGTMVEFSVGDGPGAEVSPERVATDAAGLAAARWVLGDAPGEQTVQATVPAADELSVTFSAMAAGGDGNDDNDDDDGDDGDGNDFGVPERLVFFTQPSDTDEDERIRPAVRVGVVDDNGVLVVTARIEVELALEGGPPGHLKGDRTDRSRAGVAEFDDLRVDREGDEYRFRATAPGLESALSARFEVEED